MAQGLGLALDFSLGFSEQLLLRGALGRLLDAESLALRNYLRDPTNHPR